MRTLKIRLKAKWSTYGVGQILKPEYALGMKLIGFGIAEPYARASEKEAGDERLRDLEEATECAAVAPAENASLPAPTPRVAPVVKPPKKKKAKAKDADAAPKEKPKDAPDAPAE